MKKTEGRKSRDTVPLTCTNILALDKNKHHTLAGPGHHRRHWFDILLFKNFQNKFGNPLGNLARLMLSLVPTNAFFYAYSDIYFRAKFLTSPIVQ
jgi:recombinational DNA repair ATPase RecF